MAGHCCHWDYLLVASLDYREERTRLHIHVHSIGTNHNSCLLSILMEGDPLLGKVHNLNFLLKQTIRSICFLGFTREKKRELHDILSNVSKNEFKGSCGKTKHFASWLSGTLSSCNSIWQPSTDNRFISLNSLWQCWWGSIASGGALQRFVGEEQRRWEKCNKWTKTRIKRRNRVGVHYTSLTYRVGIVADAIIMDSTTIRDCINSAFHFSFYF